MKDITGRDLVLVALLVLAIAAIVILWVRMRRLARQVAEFPGREAAIREDTKKRSRTSHLASISEQLAPLLPGFRYNPKDVQWIGGGGAVDAIIWHGLEAGGEVEVVFLDVKVGRRAGFTDNQRRIRDAIMWKRVAFDEYRPPETSPLIQAAVLELPDDADVTSLADQEADLVSSEAPGVTETG